MDPLPPSPVFPDVAQLLESSEPRPRAVWAGQAVVGLVALVLIAALASAGAKETQQLVQAVCVVLFVMLFLAMSAISIWTVRQLRSEQQRIEGIAELVQLRRWPQALVVVQHYLSMPSRSQALRSQALVYFASVLARYHRFDDAISVYEYLLQNDLVEAGSAFGLRLARAMAMLREGHLFDADRAISELRRMAGVDSGGLALIEIYRDVITGHPVEAVELFEKRLPVMREQLGHRLADAWALVARAYDLLDRAAEAHAAFNNATLLSPQVELFRRYPELQKLQGRFVAAPAPAGVAWPPAEPNPSRSC